MFGTCKYTLSILQGRNNSALLVFILMQRNVLKGHWRCLKDQENVDCLFLLTLLYEFINQINVIVTSKVNASFHYLNIWHAGCADMAYV